MEGILPRWALIGILALNGAALANTVSLAPIMGVVAGGLILGVWLGGLARMLLGLAVAALAAALLFAPTFEARYREQFTIPAGEDRSPVVPQTVQYRYDLWTNQLLPELDGYWITGYGPDLPPAVQRFPHTESLYLALLFRGGLILLAAYAALIAAMAWAAFRATHHEDPLQQALGASLVTALGVLLFIHLLQSYFFDSGPPHVLWAVLGLLAFRDVTQWTPIVGRREELTEMQSQAAARRVTAALGTLDAGSRALLQLSYGHRVSDPDVVAVVGTDMNSMRRWRASALERLSIMTRLSESQVRQILGDSNIR